MLPKKILVATDGSDYAAAAVETAITLAGRFQSSLGILHMVNVRLLEGPLLSDLSGLVGISPFLNFQTQVREALYQKGEAVIANLLDLCRKRGVAAESHLAEGVVSKGICRTAKSYDLVCLGRHGEHAEFRGFMMGSTVEDVVRGCSRPVLVATGSPAAFDRLLVPYDGSQTAAAALALAAEMAAGLGSSLAVLHVSTDADRSRSVLEEAQAYLEHRNLQVAYLHHHGEPATAIVEAAGTDFDLVVMGAYGHSRVRELILGSTTAGVLAAVRVPLLLYR
jgi:nucleotide-binding universal stress UspA family protein